MKTTDLLVRSLLKHDRDVQYEIIPLSFNVIMFWDEDNQWAPLMGKKESLMAKKRHISSL